MLGAIPSLLQYAFMVWCSLKSTGTTLPLPLLYLTSRDQKKSDLYLFRNFKSVTEQKKKSPILCLLQSPNTGHQLQYSRFLDTSATCTAHVMAKHKQYCARIVFAFRSKLWNFFSVLLRTARRGVSNDIRSDTMLRNTHSFLSLLFQRQDMVSWWYLWFCVWARNTFQITDGLSGNMIW
jgi:hypothetical protein